MFLSSIHSSLALFSVPIHASSLMITGSRVGISPSPSSKRQKTGCLISSFFGAESTETSILVGFGGSDFTINRVTALIASDIFGKKGLPLRSKEFSSLPSSSASSESENESSSSLASSSFSVLLN